MMTFMFHNKLQRGMKISFSGSTTLLPAEAFIINLLRDRILFAEHVPIYWSITETDKPFSNVD